MDSRLAALYDTMSTENTPIGQFSALSLSNDGQRVQVMLAMASADALLQQNLGIIVETTYEDMVQATVPINNLEAIASDPNVIFVTIPPEPIPSTHDKRGHVISQGAAKMMADKLNAAGYTGKDIKVAVIDTGFDITNPEISRNIAEYRSFRTDGDIRGKNAVHGTASAETIVDIAPDAQLYLYNSSGLGFFNLVDYLIQRGDIDIITMSLAYSDSTGPHDGTNYISSKANDARNSGILWLNSGGNYAQSHWEGRFNDSDGDGWHNFQGEDETIDVDVWSAGRPLSVYLSWWGSPSQDYDLYLYEGERRLAVSNNFQPIANPFEYIVYEPEDSTTAQIAIQKYAATENAYFQLFTHAFKMNEYSVASHSIKSPADATGVMAIGASDWETDLLEPYSSHGPTIDGRTKPDVTAPTCGASSVYQNGYCGTSGASPHAAGAAALIMQKYPDAAADQVQKLLEYTVKSRHVKSNQDGTGRVDLGMFVSSDILALDNSNSACASDNSCFFPKTLRVSRGDMVTWTNADNSPITITGNSGNSNFNSGQIFRGDSYSQTFATDGTFSYSDGLHSWATGQIIVGSGVTSSPPTFSSATYNQSSGVLTITFSKTIDKQRLNLSGLDIRESGYSSGGADLTDAIIQSAANSATLTLTLVNADRTAVNSMTRPQLDISSGAVRDLDGNMITAVSDRPITVTGSSGNDDLRSMIADLRSMIDTINSRLASLESSMNSLTARVAALESGGGTPPDARLPGAPVLSKVSEVGLGIHLQWTIPLDNGATITNHKLQYGTAPTPDNTWSEDVIGGKGITVGNKIVYIAGIVPKLEPNTTYYFQAAAENRIGWGPWSNTVSGTMPGAAGVQGKVFTDTNNNNRLDPGERGRAGIEVITVSLANHSDVQRLRTDANGDFTFERNAGGYLLQAIGGGPNSYAYITIPDNTMLVQNLAY